MRFYEDSKVLRHLETDVFSGKRLLDCAPLISDGRDDRVDSLENIEPGDVVREVPGLGACNLLSPPSGILGADGWPLDLIVGHPGEALGDERGEDAPEQRRCEGRDDHGRPEHSLDGGLSVSERGGGARARELGLGLVVAVVILGVVGGHGAARRHRNRVGGGGGVASPALVTMT